MALSKTFSAQAALKTCEEHEMEELDMYCKTCGKPICEECLKKCHIQHDWCKISKMARQLRTEIPDLKRKITSQANTSFIGRRNVIKYVREKYDTTMADNTKNLACARSELHALVDNIIDSNLDECQTHRERIETQLLELEATYNPCETKINELTNFFKTGSDKYSDFDLIELYDNLRHAVSQMETLPALNAGLFEQKYFEGTKTDKKRVLSAIGEIKTINSNNCKENVEKIAELNLKGTGLCCIDARSENDALIIMPKTVQLISINGDVKSTRRRDTSCYNFATTSDDEIILCDDEKNEVKMIDKSDKCCVLFNTAELHPKYVSMSNAGELLISMWDEDSYSRTSASRRLVKRMTLGGEVVCVYEHDNDGKTPLLNRPKQTVEHYNGDVSVIDKSKNESGKLTGVVYGFDYNGTVKFRYFGVPDRHRYNPIGMSCDVFGNTITSDCGNRTVHLIDSNGNFVRYLITADMVNQDIYAVSLHGNRLWVGGYDTGVVCVFQFNR